MMTYLWLDLGNTRLKYWVIKDKAVIAFDAKEHLKAPNELLLGLSPTLKRFRPHFIGVSSVLGVTINQKIAHTLQSLNAPFEFAKVQATHPQLTTHYNALELGVDRWLQLLGLADKTRHCVVGCGTALTIDLLDGDTHLGGYILPNAYMQRHALYAGTQQIAVKAGRFDSLSLGKNTFDAVNRGILFGIVSTVNTILAQNPSFRPTLTGGGASWLLPHLDPNHQAVIVTDLLLAGLIRYFDL